MAYRDMEKKGAGEGKPQQNADLDVEHVIGPKRTFSKLAMPSIGTAGKREYGTTEKLKASYIVEEGRAAAAQMSAFKKPFYATWNSIPVIYSVEIGWELGIAMVKDMFSKDALNLKPNYPRLNFTPLENSFTRRPNGIGNWIADIAFDGKPYRLLSDMRDGYLYSPDGGSLRNVFPSTIKNMINDSAGMAILKTQRADLLERLVKGYSENFGDMEKMDDDRLLVALKGVGRGNAMLFYMYGFRDSQIEVADRVLEKNIRNSGLSAEEKETLVQGIMRCQSEMRLHALNRGAGGVGKWRANLEFTKMMYESRELPQTLGTREKGIFSKLPEGTQKSVNRLFKIREELAQEFNQTMEPIEYCRSTFYSLSGELGKRLVGRGRINNMEEANFLTIEEISKLVKGGEADPDAILRRKRELGKIERQ